MYLLPGMKELLLSLKKTGIKIALASASKNALTVINRLGLDNVFEVVVDPTTLLFGKPDPEIFVKAAEMLGVPYAACVGVEDAPAGVEAIKGAGMLAVGVGSPSVLKAADVVFESTTKLASELYNVWSERQAKAA